MKFSSRTSLIRGLEEADELQPNFIPLLRLTGEYYDLIGEQDKAIEIYLHLLELYPGEPAWLRYDKKIVKYNENKKRNE